MSKFYIAEDYLFIYLKMNTVWDCCRTKEKIQPQNTTKDVEQLIGQKQ